MATEYLWHALAPALLVLVVPVSIFYSSLVLIDSCSRVDQASVSANFVAVSFVFVLAF